MDSQKSVSAKTHTFYVKGMHCHSCVVLTESEIGDLPYITSAKTSLTTQTIEVTGNFPYASLAEIAQELTKSIEKHGYSLSLEREEEKRHWSDFTVAIPIALVFIVGFVLLQKMGIVNLVNSDKVTYGTAFLIGVVASLSTCLAVVGGLLLSLSANYAKSGDAIKPQLMFHAGRLISFFILGGAIGLLGSAFQLTTTMNIILSIIIAGVMFILGINLLDIFPWAKRFQFAPPKSLSQKAMNATNVTHSIAPFLVGIATFFLPCGFTQSMQVYTLSTGNFLSGAMTMFVFALGTLPVLALMSFSSLTIKPGKTSRIFFKSAGIVVIVFAMFNLLNSLVVAGIIPPLFTL